MGGHDVEGVLLSGGEGCMHISLLLLFVWLNSRY